MRAVKRGFLVDLPRENHLCRGLVEQSGTGSSRSATRPIRACATIANIRFFEQQPLPRTRQRSDSHFRKAKITSATPSLNQIFHSPGYVFDGYVRIYAVLIKQIDRIGLKSLERGVRDLFDVLRPAVEPNLFAGIWIKYEPEFGGDHYTLSTMRRKTSPTSSSLTRRTFTSRYQA